MLLLEALYLDDTIGRSMSTFDTTKNHLQTIIKQISEGKIQLPDFQRGWVWDDEHVRSLLISVARSFPVGAVMLLQTGGFVRFQVRPVENLTFSGNIPEPEFLILDGQQRLTSLTQVLALNVPVKTFDEKGKPISRYYYIDIDAALEDSRLEDAFIAVEEDRKIKTNFNRDIALDLSGASGKFKPLLAAAQCRAFCVVDVVGGDPRHRDVCAHSNRPSPSGPPPRSRSRSRSAAL